MLYEDAHQIMLAWAKHLEALHERYAALFISSIPSSLLPESRERIVAAMNIVAKSYFDAGDYQTSEELKQAMGPLALYADDDEALSAAAFKFGQAEIREAISLRLQRIHQADLQMSWMKPE